MRKIILALRVQFSEPYISRTRTRRIDTVDLYAKFKIFYYLEIGA